MNKTVLILLLALYSASAFTQYRGYGGYSKGKWSAGYTGGWGNFGFSGFTDDNKSDTDADLTGASDDTDSIVTGGAYSCSDAIAKVNGAFDQLVEDVRAQANEWIVYSDLDAIDEISYYLADNCNVQNLDVVSQGKNGASGSQACQGLGELLKAAIQQGTAGAFRGDYQQGAQLSEQALSVGQGVEKGCQVRVVKKQQEQEQSQQENQEEEIEQEEKIEQPQEVTTQGHDSLANILYRKLGKTTTSQSQGGNDYASQYTSKYAGKYTSQYAGSYGNYTGYGNDYIDQYKNMSKLAGNGEGQKYGDDQAALSHRLNKEYTAKYAKDKKYQHNSEEEDNLKNEEESTFNLDDLFIDLTWM